MKLATILLNLLWVGLLLLSLVAVMFSPMMFDAPGSDKQPMLWMIFWSIAALPLNIIITLILSMRKYAQGDYRAAFMTSLIPVLIHVAVVVVLCGLA
ncbi:MAG: hypothetical protein IT269_12835 [Saprospiraceae bacterium]|nr:hypothetical protein [Saprospiraceae bacterium]